MQPNRNMVSGAVGVASGGVEVAAAGDLKCMGGYCRSGGTYGTTAQYSYFENLSVVIAR
jgi:hypothetical protein